MILIKCDLSFRDTKMSRRSNFELLLSFLATLTLLCAIIIYPNGVEATGSGSKAVKYMSEYVVKRAPSLSKYISFERRNKNC